MNDVNWKFFTRAEKERLVALRKQGYYQGFTNVLDDITPAKEIEIQKMVDFMRPVAEGFESKLRKKFEKRGTAETPEEEAKIQKELDDEFSSWKIKQDETKEKRLKSLEKKEPKAIDKKDSKK